MRKKFVQIAAFLLMLTLLPIPIASAAPAEEEEMLIRVGLYYGSNALPGANLQNSEETKISMVKTQNVYYSSSLPDGGYGYSDQITSSIVVGCYHLSLLDTFDDFDDALETAQALGGFPAWIEGEYQVRIGTYPTKEEAEEAAQDWPDVEVVGTSSYGITVVVTGTDQPIFQFDGGAEQSMLTVKPGLNDRKKTITHFKGLKYYGSFRYERINGGNLTVVNLVSLEDYINCVISREMSDSWPLEALKAQAVCARSYAVTSMGGHSSYHFDLCNTTDCQVYYGVNSVGDHTTLATELTAGEFAWYDDEIIQAFYHSSDGGATENVENVWVSALPYLRGVIDPYEALVADQIPGYQWTKTYTGKELQARMNNNGYTSCAEVADVWVSKTTPTGNVYSISVTDVNGKTFTISKYSARTVLGVTSLRFSISGGSGSGYPLADGSVLDSMSGAWVIDGDGSLSRVETNKAYAITGSGMEQVSAQNGNGGSLGTFVISGTGNGHNLGMSQWGAYAMALEGYTYEEILTFYFTGIEIHT